MFGNSKEYQDIKKLYEEKVSKPENINEITGGLGPIPNANSNNNVKVSNTNNNNSAPKTQKNVFQKIGDFLKPKVNIGSRSRFNTNNNVERKMSNIPKDEGSAVINGKKINPDFGKPGGASTDTSSEIESSASEFKANEGQKVNQRFKKDVGIVKRSQQTGAERAQDIAKKRIESGKSIEDVKQDNVDAMKARAAERNKKFQDAKKSGNLSQFRKDNPKLSGADKAKLMAKERIAAKERLKNVKVENYTPYDMVLEYLMSTQQVATIEEANYVMTEMDAETIQSIVEEQKKNLDEKFNLGKVRILPALFKGGAAVIGTKMIASKLGQQSGQNQITPSVVPSTTKKENDKKYENPDDGSIPGRYKDESLIDYYKRRNKGLQDAINKS